MLLSTKKEKEKTKKKQMKVLSRGGVGRVHARSNPKVPAEQQWDAEAQGPEHDGAFLEQVTCLR